MNFEKKNKQMNPRCEMVEYILKYLFYLEGGGVFLNGIGDF